VNDRLASAVLIFLIAGCSTTPSSLATSASIDTDLIIPAKSVGDITAALTVDDFSALIGHPQVTAQPVGVGEGFVCDGARLTYSKSNFLDVIWTDPKAQAGISSVHVHGDKWSTADGLRIGLNLTEVEAINGRPFTLSGFGWDYGGTVGSWRDGNLDGARSISTDPGPPGGLRVRFFPPRVRFDALTFDEQVAISGDQLLSSDHPIIQRLNPAVSTIDVVLNTEPCDEYFPE
jgi:hypothetical protein